VVYRIGGEEFAILCPHPHAVARLLGENIRAAIKASLRSETFEITISAGVATSSDETPDLDALFALADQRLYLAKAGGRDRVVGTTQDEEVAPLDSREGSRFT
jgi:diguanylate cyclase (GGDEF)-like protein